MATKEEVLAGLSDVDRTELTNALKAWAADGVVDPKIVLDYDVDGDGKPDAWALDASGALVLVTVDSVTDTVFESTGSGVEQGGTGEAE